jgi:hypothetical protein
MSFKEKVMTTTKNFIEKYIYSKKTVQEKNVDTKSINETKNKTKTKIKTKTKTKTNIKKNDEKLELEIRKEFNRLNEENQQKKKLSRQSP